MSPVSVIAPSKCHRSRQYMARMQSCIKAKTAVNLLDISGKLTVKNYHCHLPSSFLEIAAPRFMCTDRCTVCVGLHVSASMREREKKRCEEIKDVIE